MAQTGLFSVISLLLLSLVIAGGNSGTDSPLAFLKDLTGYQKGYKVTGLNRLKYFLSQFGYPIFCPLVDKTCVMNDEFDDSLEEALKTYQLNYHLDPTGVIDSKTVTTIMMPWCGVPYISNGVNTMQIDNNNNKSLFESYPRWPASKSHLTYSLPSNTSAIAARTINRALKKWAYKTHFTFSRTRNYNIADLKISFHKMDHWDNHPFDGPGGVMTHEMGPAKGILHFDGDELWSGLVQGGVLDLETVALHGIGHLLGLGHSSVEDAIMYPSFGLGESKNVHGDDIVGIKSMYNI